MRAWIATLCFSVFGCAGPATEQIRGFDVNHERARYAAEVVHTDPKGRRLVALFFLSDDELRYFGKGGRLLDDDDVRKVLGAFYVTRQFSIPHSYDEAELRRYYSRRVRDGSYDVTFDFYLQHRNQPFSKDDLETLRRFGIRQSPAVVLLDAQGKVLYEEQGHMPLSHRMVELLEVHTPLRPR